MELTKFVISLLLLALIVDSRKHHHKHKLNFLSGERKHDIPDISYFKRNVNQELTPNVNESAAVNQEFLDFAKVNNNYSITLACKEDHHLCSFLSFP